VGVAGAGGVAERRRRGSEPNVPRDQKGKIQLKTVFPDWLKMQCCTWRTTCCSRDVACCMLLAGSGTLPVPVAHPRGAAN